MAASTCPIPVTAVPGTRTVLTIDDEEPIRQLVSAFLGYGGYRVIEAEDGMQGLQLAIEEEVDVILLDVNMPGMSGREVVQRLKSDPRTRQIPVIMLSALAQFTDKVAGLDAGADEYVGKPVEGTELIARVHAMIRLRELQEELVRLEKERHDKQLAFATDVQRGLLPGETPKLQELESAVRYQPCESVGGDFYDYIDAPDGSRYLILGDAEGHGVSASILMARAGAFVRAALMGSDVSGPGELLTQVNHLMYHDHSPSILLPMVCLSFNLDEMTARYASAGHEGAVIYHAGRDECTSLGSTGPVLGAIRCSDFDVTEFPLHENDLVACFTDGLIDGVNRDGEPFGVARVQGLLRAYASDPTEAIVDRIISAWSEHTDGEAEDDVTLILTRCTVLDFAEEPELEFVEEPE